ncbi:uncharacterized protein LOC114297741 [Camellia sinensis]|uniref:uncharacterized protein LOC114297741 n=1 Tax=Camellia sinensis TaxID=4442 RepID=UPI001035C30D|nr:uncharacterized protein LOC114297741 [Camellia sinensis]
MMEPELCSSRVLSPFREESGDEELSVLPRHTKVVVTGNNRTKSVLVGLQGVVKKAVGLGGWHWLVLKNGVEVKLQRNALSVLEPPTGNEEDEDDFGNSSSSSDIGEKDNDFCHGIEFSKLSKPRVRYTRPWITSASAKSSNRSIYREVHSNIRTSQVVSNMKGNVVTLGILNNCNLFIPSPKCNMHCLWLGDILSFVEFTTAIGLYSSLNANPNLTKEQVVNVVQQHFASQKVDEVQVIAEFIHAAKRLKSADT